MFSLKDHLTEVLINSGLITAHQLLEAIEVQKKKGGRLSDIIVDLKFVKKSSLILTLSEEFKLPSIDLKRLKIDSEAVKTISVDIALHYQIMPISKVGDAITLAMSDPLNVFTIDEIKAFSGHKINPIITTSKDILREIELYYPDAAKSAIDDLLKEADTTPIKFIIEEKGALSSYQEVDALGDEVITAKVTNKILESGVRKRSSDILIEPQEKRLRIRFRIDGVLQEEQAPSKAMYASIVSRVKIMSNLDIAEHRFPQDGRFKAAMLGRQVDFRVSILPSTLGEKIAIRILDQTSAVLDIEKLGFSRDGISKLQKAARLPHGMLLVCGPTGSGKTTTLYSILKFVDSPERNIVTVEDPVEFQLEGINQVTAKPEIGLTFARALRSILRQDPNIIMIGEIRDCETADIAIKSALTGHLVLSTLHTTTASGAIVRLINMGVEPYLINSSLVCVVAQRLVRKVCYNCKEKYTIKKEILDSLKFNTAGMEKFEFFRGKGCHGCLNSGYSGRVGIAEVLLLSAQTRELVLKRSQEHAIKDQACKEGMKTLREDGLRVAQEGITTLEEVLRVTEADE